ncbi:CDK2-associated and cullin domain-containing protein 1 isoform X1 [Notolabrus celidotus]|uniref:CDK2-associated and cullin domain-containing protein 1 isoform X1 n=1 Tax=Notolabrus celidotus TaxID=1203425 RepID=UPI001490698C|nr:CDK2-associated and cullin domain-containing protein 1 isoform X1 [Notolabrus celidotus]
MVLFVDVVTPGVCTQEGNKKMNALDGDILDVEGDHSRFSCVSLSRGRERSGQLPDAAPVPQHVSLSVPEGKLGCRRGTGLSCSPGLLKLTQLDKGSASREARETGDTAAPVDRGFTIDPPKFRKFACSRELTPGPGLLQTSSYSARCDITTVLSLLSVLNTEAMEDYRKNHWPNLEKTIDRLLVHNPTDHISVSYAQIYSYVYKCVCQQHSELLYNDLMHKISTHLQQVSIYLEASPPENIIENFNDVLSQYTASLQCIVPVFMYLNKFYVEAKLNRDLKQDLMKLFADHVAEKHVNTLISLLIQANSMPFQVQPSTMASVVKGLHSLQPEWAKLAPALFSGFIPQINPPAEESLLSDYASYDQKLQLELSMNGFSRGDQSRKRTSDDS